MMWLSDCQVWILLTSEVNIPVFLTQAQTGVSSGSEMVFSSGRQKYGLLVTAAVELGAVMNVLTPWPFRGAVRALSALVITVACAAEAAKAAIIG